MGRRTLLALSLAGSLWSCADLGGLSSGAGSRDASTDSAQTSDGALSDTSSFDAVGDGDATADAAPSCPGSAGPVAIRVGSPNPFCIDTTEVTNAHYRAFLAAKGTDTSGQIPVCAWNTSYVPGSATGWPLPTTIDQYPVVGVNWCDAHAYSAWAGKRLCGLIGGGSVNANNTSPLYSQWMDACSMDGQKVFPYGDSFNVNDCDTGPNATSPIAVGSRASCVGGYPGLFDMSGNVEEWEDSCTPDGTDLSGASDLCARRGGSYNDGTPIPNYQCTSSLTQPRNAQSIDGGFRCCGP